MTFFLASTCLVLAQERELKEKEYNQWSIEVNSGVNKGVKPYSEGYYSSDPTKYINFNGIKHFDIGTRYMFSSVFGLKLDVAYDQISNHSGSGSMPFDTRQYRVGFQGVSNLARILKFEEFTNRVGLLVHVGAEIAQRTPKIGPNHGETEQDGGIILGLTPQFRISNRISLTGDFTVITNIKQHYTWDGRNSATENNLSGVLYTTTLGLTFYLGKKAEHADWWKEDDKSVGFIDTESRKRLDSIETLMNDTDKDGVQDYLDTENNTPNGVAVDTKGRFIDKNNNNIPDEIEKKSIDEEVKLKTDVNSIEYVAKIVEQGFVNVFFDVNKEIPNSGSVNSIYFLIKYLQDKPDSRIVLKGYSDKTGNEATNLKLSERRAKYVYDLIIAKGIDSNRVSIEAMGNDNSYDATMKPLLGLARRVSIQVVK